MKLKKLVALFLTVVMTAGVAAGCNNTSSASSAASEAASAAASAAESAKAASGGSGRVFKVAFLPTDMSATFAAWLASELKKSFASYGDMQLTTLDSKNVLETQLSNLETCVSQKYDYIILLPLEPKAEDSIVENYIRQGTPIMMINLDDFGAKDASSVIANPYDLGTIVAKYAKTQLADDANVVVILGPSGNTDSIERRKAYNDILFSKTKIKILDEQIGGWEKSKGMSLMENWIQKYGDKIDAVVSMNDAMAIGAYEAAKEAGLADKMKFFGVDGLADAAVSINSGEMTATALQDASVMAKQGTDICHDILTGTLKGPKKVQIPVTLITKDNVATYIAKYKANGMLK